MKNPSYFDLITCKSLAGAPFDTNTKNIELFVNGGIKFYDLGTGVGFSDFDFILSHIWAQNIENFKILGSFHSEELERFLKYFKYPIINIYKTKDILEHVPEMKKVIENRVVLRCSGTMRGIELRNLLLLQSHQAYEKSEDRRNAILKKLGEEIGAQTNWNTAYSGKVELRYPIESFKPIYHIILGFLWSLSGKDYLSIDRLTLHGDRFTIYLSRISNLTRDVFDRDNEKQIFTCEYTTNGLIINDTLWTMKDNLMPDKFLRLIYLYFSTHRNRSIELGELIEFNKTIQDSGIQERQLTADNLRKNYIKQINLKFRESYNSDLLDMKGSLIKANSLAGIQVVYPEEK